ncbi:MAG: class II glutamine amidotransferase [Gammaproteobacteria bacterium]|nr:class II glutamine amidotransferase [Gammaproteobacteria bacterium]
MCRFIAYAGNPIILDDVLYKPKNSLIRQSIHAREADEPLNGDGFGLGWYVPEIDPYPALFTSIQPAWNDRNLQYLAPKIRSNCFFAHVRAASSGGVSILNCHPFHYHRFLFMHNGDIAEFHKIKRYLRRQLSDEAYDWIKGSTDSEHMFALFIDIFNQNKCHLTAEDIGGAFEETLQRIQLLQKEQHVEGINYINAAITDGRSIVAVRYISEKASKAPSLHFSEGSYYEYYGGVCHMRPSRAGQNGAVLVVSETLNSYKAEWQDIPVNYMLLVRDDLSTKLQPVKV